MSNDLLPRYKRTALGVIPADWDVLTFSDICIKVQDGTHFSPKIKGNDYRYITSRHVRFGFLDISSVDWIDTLQHEAIYKRCDVKRGDILLTKDGANTGNAALNDLDEEFSLLSSVAFLRFAPESYVGNYFLQQILSVAGQQRIKDAMSGNAITRLTLKKINELRFPIPPFAEQRAIATALSDVDALLAKLEQLIVKKRDLKQAAMQQLLPARTRLSGFNRAWTKYRISEIAEVKTGPFGSALHESDYVVAGTPIITVEHLTEFGVLHSKLPRVSDDDLKRLDAYILREGDIVFSRVGSIDRNALIRATEDGWLFSGRLLRLRLDISRAFAPYLSFCFHTEPFKESIRAVAVGQTMPSLNTKILNGIEISLPELTEQRAIAAILTDMDADIAALEARRDKTRALKQGMMQELLTGRIRLL